MTTKKVKAPAKKEAVKKTTTTKKTVTIKEPLTKSQILAHIAESAELSKKQASNALDALVALIEGSVKAKGPGSFTLPGVLKINIVKKPAKKARKGTNPFTGEETTFKAKPAYNAVKIRALKKLKETAA